MLFQKEIKSEQRFPSAMGAAWIWGTLACILFYSLIWFGPLNIPIVRRFCSTQLVSLVLVELFFVASTAVTLKSLASYRQYRALVQEKSALRDLCETNTDEWMGLAFETRLAWFRDRWIACESKREDSWFSKRFLDLLDRLEAYRTPTNFDPLLGLLAARDQQECNTRYHLLRMMALTLPAIGVLGSIFGVSASMSSVDMSDLSFASAATRDGLRNGLVSAMDALALGGVLLLAIRITLALVWSHERSLRSQIQSALEDVSQLCFRELPVDVPKKHLDVDQRTMASDSSMHAFVRMQCDLWEQTISAAHEHWNEITSKSSDMVFQSLASALESAMSKHDHILKDHVSEISRVQTEGAIAIDARWQQWQITLTEKARELHKQQRDANEQVALLHLLIEKLDTIASLEKPIQTTLERLTDIDRFHDAAICLTEAVAVLGTQMERHGLLGRQPARRRTDDSVTSQARDGSNEAENQSSVLPLIRKAA
jgi:hypothetical protein